MKIHACYTGLAVIVSLSLSGCVHTPVRAFVPIIVRSPVETLDIPEPVLPELAAVAMPNIEVPEASEMDREMRRWRRKPWPKTVVAATVAAVPPPGPSGAVGSPAAPLAMVIGELREGGEAAAGKQQQASTILEATDRRLAEMPTSVTRSKKTQVNQIKEFQKKARAAVRSGDAQGAHTLATKASVLMDDLLK